MTLAFLSLFAGFLTILAPCVLPLLPIIVSGSIQEKSVIRPFIITLSLATSIVLFTLLLKATTAFIAIPAWFWSIASGIIIIFFGLTLLFPHQWEIISFKLGLGKSQNLLNASSQKKGVWGMVLLGMSLGPVFASCSPTYALILATVLPANFTAGVFYLTLYSIGLAIPLFLIAVFGQKVVQRFTGIANPEGPFKKILGAILLFFGLLILTGLDKDIETWILNQGSFNTSTTIEQNLLEKFEY
jgi:cytochrome c-type biogenesis protein